MSNVDNLKERFETLIAFIVDSKTQVETDTIPELSDLDATVKALCTDVKKAEMETAQALQPVMGDMITHLDDLAEALRAYRDRHAKD